MSLREIENLRCAIEAAWATGELAGGSEAAFTFLVSEEDYAALDWPEDSLPNDDYARGKTALLEWRTRKHGYDGRCRFDITVSPEVDQYK